jgi:dienelactone hydrolase
VIKDHIGLIGHSHGGSTTLRSLQDEYHLARRGLRGGVAYYPGCSAARDRNVDLPLLILIGEEDNWMRAEWCHDLEAAGFKRPDLVEVIYYRGAGHSFDFVPEDSATIDAETRTKEFFDKLLR